MSSAGRIKRIEKMLLQLRKNRKRIMELRAENRELGAELVKLQEEMYRRQVERGEIELVGVEKQKEGK